MYSAPAFDELALNMGEQTSSADKDTLDCGVLPHRASKKARKASLLSQVLGLPNGKETEKAAAEVAYDAARQRNAVWDAATFVPRGRQRDPCEEATNGDELARRALEKGTVVGMNAWRLLGNSRRAAATLAEHNAYVIALKLALWRAGVAPVSHADASASPVGSRGGGLPL
ncbi:hypothetical protein I4F81_006033 [Pyropia yezoensis]|uniref:Uncharacterized protein n=1 Tax=Pyropia yezoensis TaxID=2788 RepID=A0ACC3C122_PYRYE|nr:hypothetical protein I4F81_006033 [Neopyropia yezoensis]